MKLLKYPENINEIKKVTSMLDYSASLVPEATRDAVIKACNEAKAYGFAAVPVFSGWIPLVAECLSGTNIRPQVTVGFPSGGVSTKAKVAETETGIADGAREVDMVLNIGKLLTGCYDFVRADIKAVVDAAKPHNIGVKVIMEVGYLTDDLKKKAAELSIEAGAEFIKTCTGFAPGKATVHDILLLKEFVGDQIKIKASGGVTSLEEGLDYINLGASRVAGRNPITDQLKRLGIEKL